MTAITSNVKALQRAADRFAALFHAHLAGFLEEGLREGTTQEAEARLEVRIHGFGKGQNAYGGGGGGSSSGGSVCFANKPFTDDFGKGTLCTQAPCADTSGSTQNFKPGTCSSSKVKYGCCDIPGDLTVYAYEPCTTGNCQSLADWNETCDQLGGTGRAGVCP